jgi:hypothetical protein
VLEFAPIACLASFRVVPDQVLAVCVRRETTVALWECRVVSLANLGSTAQHKVPALVLVAVQASLRAALDQALVAIACQDASVESQG